MRPDSFNHLQLMPLDTKAARNYVLQLGRVQYPSDAEVRYRIEGHLDDALSSGATAKLMTTPLQLTIMTLLMAKRSKLPQTRHELFSSYFAVIFERESNKHVGKLSEILFSQKANMKFIHEQAGFVLHQRAERVGYADALLSRSELEQLMTRHFVEEEEFDPSEAQELTIGLMQVATERLVLLVPKIADYFGFEVRSLQEFMAASYFLAKGESCAEVPFSLTVMSAHWRNTWLLAAGQVFDERPVMREMVIGLVESAMTATRDVRAAAIGPNLALDMLTDGLAYSSPKYTRRLARACVELLDFPPGSHTRDLNRALRHVAQFEASAKDLILDRVSYGLKNKGSGLVSMLLLLSSWRKEGFEREKVRLRLDPALRSLDDDAGAVLLWAAQGTPEMDSLNEWAKRGLSPVDDTDLSQLLAGMIPPGKKLKWRTALRKQRVVTYAFRDSKVHVPILDPTTRSSVVDWLADESAREWAADCVFDRELGFAPVASYFSGELASFFHQSPVVWPGSFAFEI